MDPESSDSREAFDPSTVHKQDCYFEDISQTLKDYMKAADFLQRPKPWNSTTNQQLEDSMHTELRERNINSPQLDRTLHLSAAFAEMIYYGLSLEQKRIIALYTWYLIYVDDVAPQNSAPFLAFQDRFLHCLPQLDPVLDSFADVLHSIQDHYDVVFANIIVSDTLNFITVTCMEPVIGSFSLTSNAALLPWYYRSRTGVGAVYGLFVFPRSRKPDIGVILQTIPAMDFWIAGTNDFLSFYKEELGGETDTYINSRAKVEGKMPKDVFGQLKFDLADVAKCIDAVIGGSTANMIEGWSEFVYGYIWWHLEGDRYKLIEFLGL